VSEIGKVRRSGIVHCAIYTRKSSEEGLEQAFNSLDAQREACEAYIKSQKHEGWTLIQDLYDDGGISGGTMERPALKRLLADIEAGRVDTVVVYKVDRLTRSLSDFSKIVSVFDARGVSFVSITQQFNTTTSMGRLTLNILLSFAQFEREVTGERIRDKVAASKKKGMWMGGVVPLGYEVKDRKLNVNEQEAKAVRLIYSRYVELGSVRLLAADLEQKGIRGKPAAKSVNSGSEGSILSRGALYRILSNRLYLGEVHHQGSYYPGEHTAIIDRELWNKAALVLADNRNEHRHGATAEVPSLLAGLLRDASGEPLTPSHASKGDRRYRYYVSRSLLTATREDSPERLRVPAGDIEAIVEARVTDLLASPADLHPIIGPRIEDAAELSRLMAKAGKLAKDWPSQGAPTRRAFLSQILSEVIVYCEHVDIRVVPESFISALSSWPKTAPCRHSTQVGSVDDSVILTVPASLRRSGIGKRMIIEGARRSEPDPSLIKLLVKAFEIRSVLLAAQGATLESIADRIGINSSYATRLLRLSFLSPEIVRMILDGRHPPTLTARRLLADTRLPLSWNDQLAAIS
jgi:site-specific DNA recombinase